MSFLSKLLTHVPKDSFKIPMADFIALEHYEADGNVYEIYKHKDSNVQIVVNVDTMKVVDIKPGRYMYY